MDSKSEINSSCEWNFISGQSCSHGDHCNEKKEDALSFAQGFSNLITKSGLKRVQISFQSFEYKITTLLPFFTEIFSQISVFENF